jgi:hypothetical protein
LRLDFEVYPPVKPFSKKNKGDPLFRLCVCSFVLINNC